MRVLRAGLLYFAVVFATGFALGTIRTLWVAPRLGERAAELAEAPLMLAAVYIAARWIVRRRAGISSRGEWLRVGAVALTFMLCLEFTLVLALRGLSLADYWSGHDPVGAAVYLLSLGVFALMPLILTWSWKAPAADP